MFWYFIGMVFVVFNLDMVIGSDIVFSVNVCVGDVFRGLDGCWYEIGNVISVIVLIIKFVY